MGVNASANLVVGVSMDKLFKEFIEGSSTHDEFDKFGKETGKTFEEHIYIGVLHNGKEVLLSNNKDSRGNWEYDFYESLNFDGGEYCGDIENVELLIHYGDCETFALDQRVMGISVSETGGFEDGNLVVKVDENLTNDAIMRCRKQLAELFGYVGDINLYLINSVSY